MCRRWAGEDVGMGRLGPIEGSPGCMHPAEVAYRRKEEEPRVGEPRKSARASQIAGGGGCRRWGLVTASFCAPTIGQLGLVVRAHWGPHRGTTWFDFSKFGVS